MQKYLLLLIGLASFSSLKAVSEKKIPKKPYQAFSSGFYLNADIGRAKYKAPNFFVRSKPANSLRPGLGVFISAGFHKRFFANIAAGYTSSSFIFKFSDVNGEPRLSQLDMGFYQGKANVNFVLNPESYNGFFYVGAGAQALQRVYTKEQYVNTPIENTVWPKTSIFPEILFGYRSYFNQGSYIQPAISFRFQPQRTLIYDRTLNQISAGISIGGDIRQLFKRGPKTNKSNIIDL